MPTYTWIRNKSNTRHSWGRYSVEPGQVGIVPIEVADWLRKQPQREFEIVSDNPETWVFKKTPHRPFSPRYMK